MPPRRRSEMRAKKAIWATYMAFITTCPRRAIATPPPPPPPLRLEGVVVHPDYVRTWLCKVPRVESS